MSNLVHFEGIQSISDALGVSRQTVKRRLGAGSWPEVVKVEGTHGWTWSVPGPRLIEIAEREGWTIALDGPEPGPDLISQPEKQDRPDGLLVMADLLAGAITVQLELAGDVVAAEGRAARAEEGLVRVEAERERLWSDLEQREALLQRTVLDLGNAKGALEAVEAAHLEAVTAAEGASAMASKLERETQVHLLAAEGAMGWLARRRYRNRLRS